ncbi:MAG: hypothetical protein R3F07_16925 [Opitutaceae bacterium]
MARSDPGKRLFRLLFWMVAILIPAAVSGALPRGVGQFVFNDPETGREIACWYVLADSYERSDPPVIVFHGMKRNPDDYRDSWIEDAERFGLFVVVPYFSEEDYPGTSGYNLGNLFSSESDRTRKPESVSSFRIPEVVFDHLSSSDGETEAAGYMVFGHSAGAQFVHRMIALHPDPRLRLAIAANAGWYTYPNVTDDWPYGFRGTGLTEADLPPLLGANLVILLGDQDIDETQDNLRRTPEAMLQGRHRFERGHRFFQVGQAQAACMGVPFGWRIQVVPGVAHDQGGMAPVAAALMAEAIRGDRAGHSCEAGD